MDAACLRIPRAPQPGLATATWISDDILAMSRPSERSVHKFGLAEDLASRGITCVMNTQEPGEHPFCGERLVGPSTGGGDRGDGGQCFTYRPSSFEARGIAVHLVGWPDLMPPSLAHVAACVRLACGYLDAGGKVAVHCHAGFGRTGVLIACVLVHRLGLSGDAAIATVRARRPQCIQNRRQADAVRAFAAAWPGIMAQPPGADGVGDAEVAEDPTSSGPSPGVTPPGHFPRLASALPMPSEDIRAAQLSRAGWMPWRSAFVSLSTFSRPPPPLSGGSGSRQ